MKINKFNFEKFEVAKLKNSRTIIGGDGTDSDEGQKTTGGTDNPVRTITSIVDDPQTTI